MKIIIADTKVSLKKSECIRYSSPNILAFSKTFITHHTYYFQWCHAAFVIFRSNYFWMTFQRYCWIIRHRVYFLLGLLFYIMCIEILHISVYNRSLVLYSDLLTAQEVWVRDQRQPSLNLRSGDFICHGDRTAAKKKKRKKVMIRTPRPDRRHS